MSRSTLTFLKHEIILSRVSLDIAAVSKRPVLDGYHIWRMIAPRSLSDACREFGVPLEQAHDARADAEATD